MSKFRYAVISGVNFKDMGPNVKSVIGMLTSVLAKTGAAPPEPSSVE
jgi:hypothetical protein